MQAESGQQLNQIVRRKEIERQATGGVFFWGVGNAPNRATRELALTETKVPVIFSVMKSAPRQHDAHPDCLIVWKKYINRYGDVRELPEACLVTSRARKGISQVHYALVCESTTPLGLSDVGPFDHRSYVNFGANGKKIAGSQVTALVIRSQVAEVEVSYRANMVANLTGDYWVKLLDPVTVSGRRQAELLDQIALTVRTPEEWRTLVKGLRNLPSEGHLRCSEPALPLDSAGAILPPLCQV